MAVSVERLWANTTTGLEAAEAGAVHAIIHSLLYLFGQAFTYTSVIIVRHEFENHHASDTSC